MKVVINKHGQMIIIQIIIVNIKINRTLISMGEIIMQMKNNITTDILVRIKKLLIYFKK